MLVFLWYKATDFRGIAGDCRLTVINGYLWFYSVMSDGLKIVSVKRDGYHPPPPRPLCIPVKKLLTMEALFGAPQYFWGSFSYLM